MFEVLALYGTCAATIDDLFDLSENRALAVQFLGQIHHWRLLQERSPARIETSPIFSSQLQALNLVLKAITA